HALVHHRTLLSFPTRRSSDLISVYGAPGGEVLIRGRKEPALAKSDKDLLKTLRSSGVRKKVARVLTESTGSSNRGKQPKVVTSTDRKSTRLNSSHRTISYAVF